MIIGKYAFGSWGGSSAATGTQRLYAVFMVGGSFPAVKAAVEAAMTDVSSVAVVTAGTDARTSPSLPVAGAATLRKE
jgi:hypothetical protein